MTKKDFFHLVNKVAQNDFDRAFIMIETYNLLNDAEYFFINKRVSYKTVTANGTYVFHDAWANEKEPEQLYFKIGKTPFDE